MYTSTLSEQERRAQADWMREMGFLDNNQRRELNAGFGALTFHGAPVEWDDAAPSGEIRALNTNYLQFIAHSDANFKPTEKIRQPDQDAWSTHLLFQGELVGSAPRFQGVINSVTA